MKRSVTLTIGFTDGPTAVVSKDFTQEADVPYFGYNTNFWGVTVEFGTSFGNSSEWRYHWDYGDGTTGQNASWTATCKTYEAPGLYNVKLRVVRTRNCAQTPCEEHAILRTVDVPNRQPEAAFQWSRDGKTLRVDATASRDEPAVGESWHLGINYNCGFLRTANQLSYRWDFGDGTTAEGAVQSHTYRAPGVYRVRLVAQDRSGASAVRDQEVVVPNDRPVAAFDFNCNGARCDFDAAGSSDDGFIERYEWTAGTSRVVTTTPRTSFVFNGLSANNVRLDVFDKQGLSASASRVVSVNTTATEPLAFIPITPCRLYDSRNGSPIASLRTVPITATGRCSIPASADVKAIAANITAISPTAGGHLSVYKGSPSPFGTTMLNFAPATAPRGHNSVVAIGSDGRFTIAPYLANSGTTHLTADVTGYFVTATATAAASGLGFQPLPLCRAYDSRTTASPLANGGSASDRLLGACGVPSTAPAVSLQAKSFDATAGGHFVLMPSNVTSASVTSALNFPAVTTVTNSALLRLGRTATDDIRITYSAAVAATTHYTFDIDGYFASSARYKYRALEPCRLLDTRAGNGASRFAAGARQDVQIQGNCGVPRGAVAAVLNFSLVDADASTNIVVFPSDAAIPGYAIQNASAGDNIAAGAIVPLSTRQYDLGIVAGSGGLHLVADVVGYFAAETSTANDDGDSAH